MADDARLIIELEARMDKLTAQLAQANQSLYAFTFSARADWAAALDKAFDSSRLASLEVGGERLRLFGSPLAPL